MSYKQYEFNNKSYILVKDLALAWYPNAISRNPTTEVRKKLEQSGVAVTQIRATIASALGRTQTLTLWAFQAADLTRIEQISPGKVPTKQQTNDAEEKKFGCVFYIIQKYPDDAPGIIKMGKTTKTAEARSRAFYVWNPRVMREFPIKSTDEKTLIRMIANGSKQIGEEEFIVGDIDAMLQRADSAANLLSHAAELPETIAATA